ncbi:methyl-accepting chemotaxis protein [Parablautia muri]|uniref:Methyl-accepting chemotaxis protein n=1 Tax=Parablautia muri TaxID=2320879 RepID=A0A9X5GTR6_9FIRM|nr:methyl-accepting chemotaxis protein [Parablautia muri]NBJ94286.1 methyl-accepting chemotaxis protein [Parablautia muri]
MKKNKVSFFNSIKTKITLLVFISVLISTVLCLWTVIPLAEENQIELIRSYMKDMVLVAGVNIDKEMTYVGAEDALSIDNLKDVVGDITIHDMGASYAYVVASDSTMLYHPTESKIGEPVENDAVRQILGEISGGRRPETDVITYKFENTMKYAAYYVGENMDYVVVITADEDEILSENSVLLRNSCYSGSFILILCFALGFILSIQIVRPIRKITEIITSLSEMNFTENKLQVYVSRQKDEIGVMGRTIDILRKELVIMMKGISGNSESLYEASNGLSAGSGETATAVGQIEKAISEIAQGATSQAQETQAATEDIILMGNMVEDTSREMETLRENAEKVRDAGNEAMEILSALSSVNQRAKDAIQVVYDQTNITNESALKIKEATDIISEIAEETNLLSLNASIEAARAGEQGRGFAVVATQIQKLAEQSNESARQIDDIIHSLIKDSEESVQTMKEVKNIIGQQNENVIHTEQAFNNVKDGIDQSIESIGMIASKTQELDEARVRVVDVVQNLNAIAQENAASTEETAASAAEAGTTVESIAENARQLNDIAQQLERSVKKFVME